MGTTMGLPEGADTWKAGEALGDWHSQEEATEGEISEDRDQGEGRSDRKGLWAHPFQQTRDGEFGKID